MVVKIQYPEVEEFFQMDVLGMKNLCEDLGLLFTSRIRTDATAAIGIVRPEGFGRVRHLAVSDLGIEQKVCDSGKRDPDAYLDNNATRS